jgi:hypothetical protein
VDKFTRGLLSFGGTGTETGLTVFFTGADIKKVKKIGPFFGPAKNVFA